MDRIKRIVIDNRDVLIRKALIVVGTGFGIALASYLYHRANQDFDGEIITVEETTTYETSPDA